MTAPLKILYAAGLSPNDSSQFRVWALERLGHHVSTINAYDFQPSNPLLEKILFRLQAGPWVARLNREILARAEREKLDVFWADKLLALRPETLDKLRAMGVLTISYMIDNAFGPRKDPGFRLYMQDIRHFDLHVVQRDTNILDYQRAGAPDVIKVQTAFEPTVHFPPPAGWSDQQRDRGVSFIGTPYDDRAAFLTRLWCPNAVPVVISGERLWEGALEPEACKHLYRPDHGLYGRDYREAIWRSKINLSFLTHSNCDEFVHKSFEIAGCEGFLLAERSEGHMARFVEDKEAVFFSDFDECLAKIRKYLPDESARAAIAHAGRERAIRSGYDNDTQVAKIIERLHHISMGREAVTK
ncbi:MAG: glycosyltransferase [Bryocella sp.]